MKTIAIIGSTASGKSNLSIDIAHKTNSVILSLDSLSIYKQIDIASAKPTLIQREGIKHFGIDEIYPNEKFDVIQFIEYFQKAQKYAKERGKNLIIVGGTSFYLKVLCEGISKGIYEDIPFDSTLDEIYSLLYSLDKEYMQKIKKNDKYRIQKAYNIYKQANLTPTQFFKENPKRPYIKNLKIFEIIWEKEILKNRIKKRTKIMLKEGLIDEVISLEAKYTRKPNCMSSIGIIETLAYLDAKFNKKELEEKISLNTIKLAKRQNTFNKGQFKNKESNIIQSLNSEIIKYFSI